jgi:hypothetical protein
VPLDANTLQNQVQFDFSHANNVQSNHLNGLEEDKDMLSDAQHQETTAAPVTDSGHPPIENLEEFMKTLQEEVKVYTDAHKKQKRAYFAECD